MVPTKMRFFFVLCLLAVPARAQAPRIVTKEKKGKWECQLSCTGPLIPMARALRYKFVLERLGPGEKKPTLLWQTTAQRPPTVSMNDRGWIVLGRTWRRLGVSFYVPGRNKPFEYPDLTLGRGSRLFSEGLLVAGEGNHTMKKEPLRIVWLPAGNNGLDITRRRVLYSAAARRYDFEVLRWRNAIAVAWTAWDRAGHHFHVMAIDPKKHRLHSLLAESSKRKRDFKLIDLVDGRLTMVVDEKKRTLSLPPSISK